MILIKIYNEFPTTQGSTLYNFPNYMLVTLAAGGMC